ncbi:MAG: BlaI family transcriptional regulator [Firmicutes bacterium HGW-Firmicutes-7]|nr:MAG: BlaI family transcriptional regulator [Firmicutes bacterium HGW-Firmicutes-7]
MTEITLFDSEIKIMNIVWEAKIITAKEVSLIAADSIGWNKNTTYTILNKLIQKGAISRSHPNFTCQPLISKEQVQIKETKKLVQKLYEGSAKIFLSSFIEKENLSDADLQALRDIIDKKL